MYGPGIVYLLRRAGHVAVEAGKAAFWIGWFLLALGLYELAPGWHGP